MAVVFWIGCSVEVSNAEDAADTINAIDVTTPTAPVVTTSASHGWSNGDYIFLGESNITILSNRLVRVSSASGSTATLNGVDLTGQPAFSGTMTARRIASWTNLTTLTDVSASGGDAETADISTIHSSDRVEVPIGNTNLELSFTSFFDPSSAALQALRSASDRKVQKGVRITFSDGSVFAFGGFVNAPLIPTGSARQAVTTPVTIRNGQGRPVAYAAL